LKALPLIGALPTAKIAYALPPFRMEQEM